MLLTRRAWLGSTAALAATAIGPAGALPPPAITVLAPGPRDPAPLLAALAAHAEAERAAFGLPGMVLAVAAPGGLRATLALGYADLDRRLAMRPDHLVQIGSISKSLVALALFRLAAAGRFDLDAAARTALPDAPWPDAPITVAMLLNHSSALSDSFNIFPRSPDGRLWTNFASGSRFYYSNLGFNLLGAMLARASGLPFPRALRQWALAPLGMAGARPVIMNPDRARYPVGYQAFGDGPWLPDQPLAPAGWYDMDQPAGSVAATPADMLAYIAGWTALGQGRGGELLPDPLARRLVAPTIAAPEFGAGAHYAAGIAVLPVDGGQCLHHTGGMPAFHSSVTIDPAMGGVFASTNSGAGDYRPRGVTTHGVRLLRAWAEGRPLPPAPPIVAVAPIAKPDRFVGRFLAANGDSFTVARDGAGLAVTADNRTGRLVAGGDDRLIPDHPRLGRHELMADGTGKRVDRLWWGGTLYGRNRAVPTPSPAAEPAALAGHYQAVGAWGSDVSAVARGDQLVLEGVGPLARFPDGSWRTKGEALAGERFWFQAPLDRRPQRLVMSDTDLLRLQDDG